MYAKNFDSECRPVKLKELKKGEFFIASPNAKSVLIKDEYDRSDKKYMCVFFDDVGRCRMFKSDTIVYIGFTF